jgi:UDP-glucose 4-epimerase
MMKILVTGGAGFIGSHLVDALIESGHEVVVLDDLSTGRKENIAHLEGNKSLSYVEGSVIDENLVSRLIADADGVYHLAAAVGVGHVVRDPVWTIVTNTRGTEVVLSAAAERGVRVVFASTSEIYGESSAAPFREDGQRVLGPTWIHRWCYSTSKAVDEHLCMAYHDRGLPVSIVRYFNIYGPRMDPAGYGSVIARFMTQALAGDPLTVYGDGQQTRCFTYVSEAVDATIRCGTSAAALGEVYNIGSQYELTIDELAANIRQAVGSKSSIVHVPYEEVFGRGFADTRRRVPDVTKAREQLDWSARIAVDEGLGLTLRSRMRKTR